MNKFSYGNQVCKYFDKLYRKREYAQFKRYDNLIWQFKRYFNRSECFIASASGRVEVIGNHTDHNGGSVLGCGVNLDIIAAFCPNNSAVVRLISDGYSEIRFDIGKPNNIVGGVGLAEGVMSYLAQSGYNVGGVDIYTHSTVNSGAGISSSAAFEMLIAVIVNECFNDGAIPIDVMARAGQFSENKYLNKPCGLLDQGASLAGGFTLFDFADGFRSTPLNVNDDVRFVLVDTGKNHSGLSALYASIPDEMFSVAKYFGKERLIDADYEQLLHAESDIRMTLGDRPFLRAKHFFEENNRVKNSVDALKRGDIDKFIELINMSGDSSLFQLQNCAVDERDTAIADAISFIRTLGNVGVRVHGGGFAGTVLCVAKNKDFARVLSALTQKYGGCNVIPMNIRQVGATVL